MDFPLDRNEKSVRFADDENLCIYHAGAVMDFESVCRTDIWYLQVELFNMKRKALAISRETQRYGLGNLLTNTYGKNCSQAQEAINTWTQNGNGRRGLERWVNEGFAAVRGDIRRRNVKSVLRAQRKMREEGLYDAQYCMDVLSRLSEAFSVDARCFGRVLGIADEHAVRMDQASQDDTPQLTAPQCSVSLDRVAAVLPTHKFDTPQRRPLRLPSMSDMRHYC
jgi:hypothetical protein